MASIPFEIPRRAVPEYLTAVLGDYHTSQPGQLVIDLPPGHRFLLYFHGMAATGHVECGDTDRRSKRELREAAEAAAWDRLRTRHPQIAQFWIPVDRQKRVAVEAAAGMGKTASALLAALASRQATLLNPADWKREADLIAPLITGTGNPHPVENGFAFLSPYGVPYLAGSGIKGVLRRAAEELAARFRIPMDSGSRMGSFRPRYQERIFRRRKRMVSCLS